jgi:GT2 family glycosyltransferase
MALDISIVIPSRSHAAELRECLSSLFLQETSAKYEILVAYCELDHEVDAVVKSFAQARAIKTEDFMLPGTARNLGAMRASADIIGFVDADCLVDPGWVSAALQTVRDGAVLCSGMILDVNAWHMIAASDNRLQYVDFAKRRPYGTSNYFPGAHLAIRKEVLKSVGGFPEHERFAQDVMFSELVAIQWPQKVIFNPKLVVRHYGRHNWNEFLDHQKDFGFARARHGIRLNKTMRWIGKRPYLGWVLLLRRLIYISLKVIQWNFFDLPRYLFQLPFVLVGLIAWTNGFYHGMQQEKSGGQQ